MFIMHNKFRETLCIIGQFSNANVCPGASRVISLAGWLARKELISLQEIGKYWVVLCSLVEYSTFQGITV